MVCVTLDCVGITQSSVIRIIHRNVGLKCVFHLLVFTIVRFSHIFVSQGIVKMHLWCRGICNNHIIANCSQSLPVIKF